MQSDTAVAESSGGAAPSAPVWIVFECDHHRFGLPIDSVREVLPPHAFTRLPGAIPVACGLIGLRGRVVTVFDFGAAVGLRRASAQPDFRIVLVERGSAAIGLAVERMLGTASGPAEARSTGDRSTEGSAVTLEDEAVLGGGSIDGRPFVAVNGERLLVGLLASQRKDDR